MDGVSHTVEVTATTLYEAVAQGLAAIRGSEWVAGIAQGLNVVKVSKLLICGLAGTRCYVPRWLTINSFLNPESSHRSRRE